MKKLSVLAIAFAVLMTTVGISFAADVTTNTTVNTEVAKKETPKVDTMTTTKVKKVKKNHVKKVKKEEEKAK